MIPASPAFITAMKSPIKHAYIKTEFYSHDGTLLSSFSENAVKYQSFRSGVAPSHFTNYGSLYKMSSKRLGGISVDISKPVVRSISMGIGNDDGSFTWQPNGVIWISNFVKLYVGLLLADGTIEYIPQGYFVITSPSDSHNSKDANNVYITGQDKAYLLTDTRGKFNDDLTIEAGVDIATAIRTIAQTAGETMFNFDPVSVQLPYSISYSGTDTKWKAIQDLATLAQCIIFYDVNGYLRLQQVVTDFSKEPPVWTYQYGSPTETFYTGNVRAFDETNLANHIRVIGGSPQTPTIVYDLVVDETTNYNLSQTYAEQAQWLGGTFSSTTTAANTTLNNIPNTADATGSSVLLSTTGTNIYDYTDKASQFLSGVFNDVVAIDDTDYTTSGVELTGHIELAGYRLDWTTGVIPTTQSLYGTGASQSTSINLDEYTLISGNNTDAKSRLNGTDTQTDLTIGATVTVPPANNGTSTQIGLVYRTTEWIDTNDTYGYFAGLTSDGHMIFGYGSNSSTGLYTSLKDVDLSANGSNPQIIVGNQYELSISVVGNVHTIYINGIQVTQVTDSTYSSGGYGLRVFNTSAIFNNFGMFPTGGAMTGTRINTYNLSPLITLGSSSLTWVANVPSASQSVTMDVAVSTDGGTTYGAWQSVSLGASVPGLTVNQNLNNVYIQIRETLTTEDVTVTPFLESVTVQINSTFLTSGTYTSPPFQLTSTSSNPVNSSCKISWDATVPTNASLSVQLQYSTDGGNNWSGYSTYTNGEVISSITNTNDTSLCMFQFKLNLSTTDDTVSASVQDLTVQFDAPIWKNNPYSIQKIGDVLYQWNNGQPDPLITTQFQAKWTAKYELMKKLGYAEQLSMEIAPNWLHDVGDIVQVIDNQNNVNGNYQLQSFVIPLTPQIMECKLVKYVNPIGSDFNAI